MISCTGHRVQALPVSGQVTSRLGDAVVAVRHPEGDVQLKQSVNLMGAAARGCKRLFLGG